MRAFSLVLLALLVSACDSASPIALPGEVTAQGVTFRVDRTEVRRGDTVELALVNGSDRTVETGVFGCDIIERREGDAWVQREADNDRGCILPLYTVAPGTEYEGSFTIDVAPGTIRLVHAFGFEGGGGQTLASAPIRVR